MDYKHLN